MKTFTLKTLKPFHDSVHNLKREKKSTFEETDEARAKKLLDLGYVTLLGVSADRYPSNDTSAVDWSKEKAIDKNVKVDLAEPTQEDAINAAIKQVEDVTANYDNAAKAIQDRREKGSVIPGSDTPHLDASAEGMKLVAEVGATVEEVSDAMKAASGIKPKKKRKKRKDSGTQSTSSQPEQELSV